MLPLSTKAALTTRLPPSIRGHSASHTDAEASGAPIPGPESSAATRQQEQLAAPDQLGPGREGGGRREAWLLIAAFVALAMIGLGAAVLTFPQL
jgi:hypothetical protein